MTRTCPKCQELNRENAEFCEACGYRIVAYSTLAYFRGSELRQPRTDPRLQRA